MLVWLYLSLVSYTLHAKDVFGPPPRPPQSEWSAVSNATRRPLEFRASDGAVLRGWFYSPHASSAVYVIFFYGSNEDLVHEQKRLQWLAETLHVNAIAFDYRGYSFSEGKIDPLQMRMDVVEEYDDVVKDVAKPGARVVAYGWSIGTQFAIHLAKERALAGLILQAPPASAEEMASWSSHHEVPRFARGIVHITMDDQVAQAYQGATEIKTVDTPLLVIHGEKDDVVPIQQGREVFEASPAKQKRFVIFPAVHHNDLPVSEPPAGEAVAAFLSSVAQ